MAKKLEISSPHVAALMRQQKKLVPWRSATYDDEITLIELRDAHPKIEWPKIRDIFNEAVPSRRKRTTDSIKNKWKSLQTKSRMAILLAATSSVEDSPTIPAVPTGMNLEAHLKSGYDENQVSDYLPAAAAIDRSGDVHMDSQCNMGDQSIISLEASNQGFAEDNEMWSTDSMAHLATSAIDISSDAHVDSQYNYNIEDQSVISLEALNKAFADYNEMLLTHSDSMAHFEGYLGSIADEQERMEAARMVAIETASGWSGSMEW